MTAAVPDSVQPMRAAVHEIFRRKDSDYEERKGKSAGIIQGKL